MVSTPQDAHFGPPRIRLDAGAAGRKRNLRKRACDWSTGRIATTLRQLHSRWRKNDPAVDLNAEELDVINLACMLRNLFKATLL